MIPNPEKLRKQFQVLINSAYWLKISPQSSKLQEITYFSTTNWQVSNSFSSLIYLCKKLQTIVIYFPISYSELKQLTTIKSLKQLTFQNQTFLTQQTLIHFQYLQKLQILNLSLSQIQLISSDLPSLKFIGKIPLQQRWFSQPYLPPHITGMSFKFSFPFQNNIFLKISQHLPNLTTLQLNNCYLTSMNLQTITTHFNNLKSLLLCNSQIIQEKNCLQNISMLIKHKQSLQCLNIKLGENNNLKDFEVLKQLKQLKTLKISQGQQKCLKGITLNKLRQFSLYRDVYCNVKECNGLLQEFFKQHGQLERLGMSKYGEYIAALFNDGSVWGGYMNCIYVRNWGFLDNNRKTNVTDSGCFVIAKMKRLKVIHLDRNGIGDVGGMKLVRNFRNGLFSLGKNKRDVGRNNITEKGQRNMKILNRTALMGMI